MFAKIGQEVHRWFAQQWSSWEGMEIHFVFPREEMRDRAVHHIAMDMPRLAIDLRSQMEMEEVIKKDFHICGIPYFFEVDPFKQSYPLEFSDKRMNVDIILRYSCPCNNGERFEAHSTVPTYLGLSRFAFLEEMGRLYDTAKMEIIRHGAQGRDETAAQDTSGA